MDRPLLKLMPIISELCHLINDRRRRSNRSGSAVERHNVAANHDRAIEFGL
jgi:hypothetical protein